EITFINEWWKILKFFIDQGFFENDVITVLGSSTIGIIKAPEMFPGRRGRGKTIEVLPLSFPEFVEIHGLERKTALYRFEELRKLWRKYLVTGGFPRAINEKEDAAEALISGIVSEIYKHERSLDIAKDILSSILDKIPSALSYHSIAQDIGISHKTVREYIEFLKDCLLIGVAYWKNDKPRPRKEKKIFFRDPFLLQTISFWCGKKFLESALYESIVQEHLFRKFGEIYYWRNALEIDCIADNIKVEIKAGKPHRRYPKNTIVLDENDIPEFLLKIDNA
ncbi:MAG TPA: ATP-binding protein, partial [Thermoprotei archaeon]|nr:ATP-binding protein [Thermoprotei archaeon]